MRSVRSIEEIVLLGNFPSANRCPSPGGDSPFRPIIKHSEYVAGLPALLSSVPR